MQAGRMQGSWPRVCHSVLPHAGGRRDVHEPLVPEEYGVRAKPQTESVFILSAKYGLLSPDEVIDPYEQTLKNMRGEERRK